ncbi:MAG TPA: response regulator [Thermoanaerobaculia bacterium]|nr:response regulator [Thermoanaerobaculia bacterium]
MLRFLVVEDNEPTLRALKELLSEEFDAPAIDAASNVAQGSQYIATSFEAGETYDAALLDFKLPSSSGESPEIDNSLCEEVCRKHRRALVVRMTAYTQDPVVIGHLMAGFKELGGCQPLLVSKSDVAWPSILRTKLRTFLFSREILQQLTDLFGFDSSMASPAYLAKKPTQNKSGVTHRLAKLTQDIEHHWKDLDPGLQERIRKIFVVDTSGDDVRVGLL